MFDNQITLFFITAVLGALFLVSFFLSQRYTSSKAQFLFSFVDLCLVTLSTLLILSIFLNMSSMGQAFVSAAVAVLVGSLIGAIRLILHHTLGRKRKLTNQQKVELMDL